jgi:UPF0755 protein
MSLEPEPRPAESRGLDRWLLGLLILFLLSLAGIWAWRGADLLLDRGLGLLGDAGGMSSAVRERILEQRADQLLAVGDDPSLVEFEILAGERLADAALRLEAEGLIRDAESFRLLARVRGLDTQVQAGRHELSRDMDAEAVLQALLVAPGEARTLQIPEGLRLEEIAALVGRSGIVSREDFLAAAGTLDRSRWPVLADLPEAASLEGYLFPDTYELPLDVDAAGLLTLLLDTFEARLRPEMRQAAAAEGLNLHQLVTLASIVEREAVLSEERARIARVYLNRLAEPPYILNADPTIQYALGYQPEADSWWKRPLYLEDLEIDSPYNSYRLGGLPPGPIANPGLASLEGVTSPEAGPWQYFVANEIACDGSHVFAISLEEHNANVATYRREDCGR